MCHSSYAQGTDASITGKIIDGNNEPVPGVNIIIRNESTGFQTGTVSSIDGSYELKQLPVGGPYSIRVSAIGYGEQKKTGVQLNQGDNVTVNFEMSESTTELNEVVVMGNSFKSRNDRLSGATSVSAQDVQKLPTANRNFNNLAALSPLVGSGQNIGGLDSRTNAVTIDGVTAKESSFGGQGSAPYTLSMEALREFEVVSNVYDVTEGRSTGGAVRAVSKSGTNEFHGSVFGYFWDARLAADRNLRGQDVIGETKKQRGFSLGGPIIKDKLHFFVAYDGERFEESYALWNNSDDPEVFLTSGDVARSGKISPQDMDRVLSILRNGPYNVGDQQQIGQFQRDVTTDTYFAKLDWQINDRHKLTARYIGSEFLRPSRNNSDIGRQGIRESTYDFEDNSDNLLISLRSQLKPNLSNDLKLGYHFHNRGNFISTGRSPQLWIAGQSTLSTGEVADFQLIGRYNRWTPELQENQIYTLIDNVYVSKGRFDFIFGTENTITRTNGIYTHDTAGRFDFSSLEALEANEPDRYRRKHQNPGQELDGPVETGLVELSLYGQVSTEIKPNVNATLGLRYDLAIFSTAADYNPVLEQELGLRNDVKPVDVDNIQPRLNINWDVKGQGRDIVTAGAGWFMGQTTTRPYIYSLIDNGIRFTGVDISKGQLDENGNEIILPQPDYEQYDADYSTIPGDGLTTADLYPSSGSASQVVRFMDEDLELPMAFRANISYHRYLNDWLRVGVSAYYTKTTDMFVMENANLRKNAAFTLNGEGDREVYAPVDQVSGNGANQNAARISTQFEDALMFTNGMETSNKAIVLDVAARLPKGGKLNVSYTMNEARGADRYRNEDDQRFVGSSYYDYDFINDGLSEDDFKHKFLVNLVTPKIAGFTFSAFLNIVQRGRFSALLERTDVSGTRIRESTGYAAYIYDPDDPQTIAVQGEQFANDMRALLENADDNVRDYLQDNFGRYAQPNGGIQPWRYDLNVSIQNELPLHKEHKLILSLDIFNLANLIDENEGGHRTIFNDQIYNVVGFNEATQTYQYEVNPDYGSKRYEGNGFSMMLGLKYQF